MNDIIHRVHDNWIAFWCPGCKRAHSIPVKPDSQGWEWNGDVTKPTISPSLLVHGHDYMEPGEGELARKHQPTCHSFVRDGSIQFLADSEHELSGKTVPMEVWNGKV